MVRWMGAVAAVLLGVVAALVLGLGGAATDTGRAAPPDSADGELRLREQVADTGAIYVEGAFQFATVRRTRDGRLMYRTRGEEGIAARLSLRPGFYRVASWTRSCAGTCDRLDPPSGYCQGSFRVRRSRYVTATIHSGVGVPCRITNP